MALSPQWLDELRARITLSSVIMRTTKLTRAGREWKACCPFHNEKSPSFYVNDQKGFYHCFGCQAHGDVIRWMTDQRGLTFMDAVKELASQAGMEVPRPDPREAQAAEQRAGLHDVMAAAQEWFVAQLASPAGAAAREYLKRRGFNQRTVERFGFGFAPDERTALKSALSRYDEAMLVEAGLLIQVDDKAPYDRFRGRLMLPIHDARERVIAFGGRVLESRDGVAKYLNSPDTPLFDKGRTLYNLHRAGPASRRTDRVLVVEGYMDVIALAAAGIEDAVAPMGTALTERQIELLWRLSDKPVLCFDGDAAGQRAAMKAVARALPLLRPGHSLQIVQLPAGQDPDDVVRKQGTVAMEALLASPKPMLDLIWEQELTLAPLGTPEEKADLNERLNAHVNTIQHAGIKALYRRDLQERYSAFAFPPREWNKSSNKSSNVISLEAERRRLEHVRSHSKWSDRERHLYRRLGAAIAKGLMLRPYHIGINVEAFLEVGHDLRDARITAMIEALEFDDIESSSPSISDILHAKGLCEPDPAEYDFLNFPFTLKEADEQRATQMLTRAIRLYTRLPIYRRKLEVANSRFKSAMAVAADDVLDAAFAEQQALLKEVMKDKEEFYEMMQAA